MCSIVLYYLAGQSRTQFFQMANLRTPSLKVFLGGKNFLGDEDLKEGVKTWLHSLAAEQYNVGIEKLVPRYNKCLDSSGDFVEK
ncbi:hypothetical protein J6590_024325 [Homalodisca vitripennis]|nr:hypothetical protein J6590_024325 [Homalodisca vitripennis]